MLDFYFMDYFIKYMDYGSDEQITVWFTNAYKDVQSITKDKVGPCWIPADASMEISHAIRRNGALTCQNCHSENSVLDWKSLGYTEDEITAYIINPLLL